MTDPNLRFSHLDWTGGMRFTGGAPGGPTINLDGDGKVALILDTSVLVRRSRH